MHTRPLVRAGRAARAVLALIAFLSAGTASAEFIRVTAANSGDNFVYDVTSFAPPGTISLLNSATDAATHGSYSSVVQVPNQVAGTVDVLASDSVQGQIWRYTPAIGATPGGPSIVWPTATSSGIGPAHPDGLSLDSLNDLYVVTSKKPSVWVLPADPTAATGYATNPLLIDDTSFFALGDVTLQDSAVATTTTAAWGANDLLVLVGSKNNANSAELILYRASSIAQVLAGNGPRTAPDAVLIGPNQFPPNEFPTGFDFWPADALVDHPTLLIATTAGRVLRYDFTGPSGTTPTIVQVFASGLGSGLDKLKVGLQLQVPYAFVTQTPPKSTGVILQLAAPTSAGGTNLIGSATQGVDGADALAVARAAAESVSDCVNPLSAAGTLSSPKTCDIGGTGVAPHSIYNGVQTVSGNAIESTCVVATDPRWDPTTGSFNAVSLDAETVCPGFGHEIIPPTLVGGSGLTGKGFALVRTNAPGVDGVSGITVYTQENVGNILPAPAASANPLCPEAVTAWAPLASAGEGDMVEVDPVTGQTIVADEMVELTGFCDSSGIISRGMSLYGVGLTLNQNATGSMPQFAQQKILDLIATINAAPNVPAAAKQVIETGSNGSPSLAQVEAFLGQQDYGCAAKETVLVDGVLAAAQDDTSTPLGNVGTWGSSYNPNPWGEIRGRLANLYLTLNTRILGVQPNSAWPPTSADPAPQCPAPTIALTAPSSVEQGSSATIAWRVQHALSCQFTGGDAGWQSQTALDGSYVAYPTAKTSYTLSCTGPAGSISSTATVEVVPPPSMTLTASPTRVTVGQGSLTLSWAISDISTDGISYPLSCAITGGNVDLTGITTSGSESIAVPTAGGTTTYTMSCQNPTGGTASSQVSVTAFAVPSINSFAANPATVDGDEPTTLSWNASNASACAITGGGLDVTGLPASGTFQTAIIKTTTTFTLSCVNAANYAVSATTTVKDEEDD